ncbi:MBL fold metallo-hydrolase [Aliisedimentitalea scapharcae]|uniref:MBL fold metallo-hydrolase n=1 Tax=Aliisedimentitalea scapharcae TaxID=1524259 RepID=A0ABZ2XUD4_9RHOB
MTISVTRRSVLASAAALPLAAAGSGVSAENNKPAAAAHLAHSFKLGDFTLTTLLDGSAMREGPKAMFAPDASDQEFEDLSQDNFVPADRTQFYFTPTLVDTGKQKILFDTGLGLGGLGKALAQSGHSADDIDTVVITHMHPDHIGGLMKDGQPVFSNADYVTGAGEYNFWSKRDAGDRVGDLVAKNMTPLAEKTRFVDDGGAVVSGITALNAFGHTPGHMAYMLESGGQQLVLTADLANHYVWSFARPDWGFSFDVDKDQASQSRRRVLGMLAADKTPMIGYHMPFPAAGFVETHDAGFRYVPVSYQLMG